MIDEVWHEKLEVNSQSERSSRLFLIERFVFVFVLIK